MAEAGRGPRRGLGHLASAGRARRGKKEAGLLLVRGFAAGLLKPPGLRRAAPVFSLWQYSADARGVQVFSRPNAIFGGPKCFAALGLLIFEAPPRLSKDHDSRGFAAPWPLGRERLPDKNRARPTDLRRAWAPHAGSLPIFQFFCGFRKFAIFSGGWAVLL